jgi:tubulin-specific chaperone E
VNGSVLSGTILLMGSTMESIRAKDILPVSLRSLFVSCVTNRILGGYVFSETKYVISTGSFVRTSRPTDKPQSFVEAVRQKYATDDIAVPLSAAPTSNTQHVISGKVVEEVGFEKITRQLAQLGELTTVIVDGLRINKAETAISKIRETCPKIINLDLSRNLFKKFEDVGDICVELDNLRTLKLK